MPRISCARSTASARARLRHDREHVARVGQHEGADELAAERRDVGAGDRDPGGARPRTPLRERQHELDEERHPQPCEQEAERPQRRRELAHCRSAASSGERRPPRAGPAAGASAPLQRDEGCRDERPRSARSDGDARSRGARVDAEPADGEAGGDDRGHEQHRVAERARGSRGRDDRRRHHSTSAANAAADSRDFGMKPRAPQASIRRP